MKRRLLSIVAIMFVFFGVAHAQQSGTLLSFDEALVKMMANNAKLEASTYELKAAEQERKAAFGLRLPQVSVMGSYVHLGDDIGVDANSLKEPAKDLLTSIGGAGIPIPPSILGAADNLLKKDWGLTIQDRDLGFVGGVVVIPVYTGGKINAANRAAKIDEKTAYQKHEQARNSLVSELVERYYGVSLAKQAVKVRQQVVDAMQKHLHDARTLEANGMIARSERLYVEVKAAEANRDLLAAQLEEQTIQSALSNTLNEQTEFAPASMMFVLNSIEPLDHFQSEAISKSPLLQQVGLKKSLAEEGVKVQRAEYLPQFAVMGGGMLYTYQVADQVPRWAVGAGVKLNIFDGLRKEYKYSAAKNVVRQVESAGAKAESDILLLIEKLYNEMVSYRNRMPSINTSLEFAEEYVRVQNAAFREGMAPATDVVDAELNLAKTRIEKLQTAYYYDLMLARLLEAAGNSDAFTTYASSESTVFVKFD